MQENFLTNTEPEISYKNAKNISRNNSTTTTMFELAVLYLIIFITAYFGYVAVFTFILSIISTYLEFTSPTLYRNFNDIESSESLAIMNSFNGQDMVLFDYLIPRETRDALREAYRTERMEDEPILYLIRWFFSFTMN